MSILNGYNCGPSFAAGLIIGIMNGDDIHNNDIHNRSYCRKNIIYEKPIRETVDDFPVNSFSNFEPMSPFGTNLYKNYLLGFDLVECENISNYEMLAN
ncbi:hypothetical protein RhiirA1_468197 [Rhizophagus irregularis]|uniref:Uncharacterized protein n=1 Tax=Rhizophagus irregularis TaxID=588596 RepID=A0A2N0RAK4_9GLOM|nr:hypothetical protein RhiirA1_468197 [Rhizophagus irregularis]